MPNTHNPSNFLETKLFDTMGAAWFVSYCHYNLATGSCGSRNWKKVNSSPSMVRKIKAYKNAEFWIVDGNVVVKTCTSIEECKHYVEKHRDSERLFRYWMRKVLGMKESCMLCSNGSLKNKIDLDYPTMIALASGVYPFL